MNLSPTAFSGPGLLLVLVVSVLGRWPEVIKALRTRKTVLMLLASAYLVAGNWYVYVWCSYRTNGSPQASLGYFILPLVNVVAGTGVLRRSAALGSGCRPGHRGGRGRLHGHQSAASFPGSASCWRCRSPSTGSSARSRRSTESLG